MTQREVLKQIRDLGLRASYDPEFSVWRVTTPDNSEAKAYYADDAEDALSTAKYMAKAAQENPRACALPGTLSTKARDKLPAKAFGLPKERKYPMYRVARDGTLVPSGSHASNAKARAQAQYDEGNLSAAKLKQIDRKADKVLAACGTKGKKRKKNAQLLSPTAYQVAAFESVPISQLEELPTLTSGHMHNLKMEGSVQSVPTRWWLSRMTVEDGEVHGVYVEQFIDGRWQDVHQYGEVSRAENPARPWALVKSVGMDDRLMSTHTTKASAEKAMRKAGGEPDSAFQGGMRIVGVGPDGPYEVIRVQGRGTVRMRNGGRAETLGSAAEWEELDGPQRQAVLFGTTPYTDWSSRSALWEPRTHGPGMQLSARGRALGYWARRQDNLSLRPGARASNPGPTLSANDLVRELKF